MNSRSSRVLLALLCAFALMLTGWVYSQYRAMRAELRGIQTDLDASLAAWQQTAADKEELQAELKEVNAALREAQLSLDESTQKTEDMAPQIEALREEKDALQAEIDALRTADAPRTAP